MIPDQYSPSASAQAEAELLLPSLDLPDAVAAGMREALLNPGAILAPDGHIPLADCWRLAGSAAGGRVLLHQLPGSAARRWAFADRFGRLHGLLRWNEPGDTERGGDSLQGAISLRGMALRLPGGAWMEVLPGASQHPLWGASDLLVVRDGPAAMESACFEAVNYGRIGHIPPLDNPGALPPGAGEALLNTLAMLLSDQARETVHYRGPYATEQLFRSLERSFCCLEPRAEAEQKFTRGEYALALSGELAESPVAWRPVPFEPVQPHANLLVAVRDGVQAVWLGGAPYRRWEIPGGGPISGGARVWRDAAAREALYRVGLVLLGAPYRIYCTLDAQGGLVDWQEQLPQNLLCGEPRTEPAEAPWGGAAALWGDAVFAWAAHNCTPALAPAILALAPRLPVGWSYLPHGMAEIRQDRLLLQAGALDQFHRLRDGQQDPALALMLISDLCSGAAPVLRQRAQAELAAAPAPDMAALGQQGQATRQAACKTLERAVPALLQGIAQGIVQGTVKQTVE